MKKIAIGCDPNAAGLKRAIIKHLAELGYECEDYGSDDPIYANVAIEVAEAACRCDDKIFLPRIILAIARYLKNDLQGAKAALEDTRRIRPKLSTDEITRFARPEEINGLKEVGLL